MSTGRRWCFTLNNWTQPELDHLTRELSGEGPGGKVKYAIVGREVGEGGTPHLQGYINWNQSKKFARVKALLGGRCHIERARGTDEENQVYCSKGGDVACETGTPTRPGKRTDIDEIRELVVEGAGMRELWEEARSYQAFKFAQIGRGLCQRGRDWKPEVLWFHGPTGTGKSRAAFATISEEFPDDFWVSGDLVGSFFWAGYNGEAGVILDDFRGDQMKLSALLRILDRYEYRVRGLGTSTQLLARKIIITSCQTPRQAYAGCGEKIDQLLRRIDRVVDFPGEEVDEPEHPAGASNPVAQHATEVGGSTGTPTCCEWDCMYEDLDAVVEELTGC